jgi:uncharacterized membrane protein
MKRLKRIFITGILTLLPSLATIYVLYLVVSLMENLLGDFLEGILKINLPGIGVIGTVLIIFLVGLIASNVLGAKLLHFGESILNRVPIVTKLYFGAKQIVQAFSDQGKQAFNQVALVEYPRKGTYAIGFVTGLCKGEVQDKTKETLINIFIPTTPNPTSGILLLVPESDVIYLDMTVEDGLKLIVSAGVVVPKK